MEQLKKDYDNLLKRLQKAENFFLDENIADSKKLKFVDEFNKIQRKIVKMQREYKDIFNADIEESLKHLD